MKRCVRMSLFAVTASILTVVSLLYVPSVSATNEVLSAVSNKSAYAGSTIRIGDLRVNGTGDDTITLNLFVPKGTLSFWGATPGVTFTGPSTGANLQMQGLRSAVNNALDYLQFTNPNVETVTLTARLGGGDGSVFFSQNQHVYQVVTPGSPLTWAQAKAAAEASTYGGVNGYLATITSQAEDDFILARINQSGWIGSSDAAAEGVWKWVTGPEAGTQFWQGATAATGGHVVNGQFVNWNVAEPNDSGGNEDCGQIYFAVGSNGLWNDMNCMTVQPKYVVEYGAPGALPQVASTTFTLTTTPRPTPTLVSLTPAHNSVEVSTRPSMQVKFNMAVNVCSGECAISLIRLHDEVVIANWYPGVEGFSGNDTNTLSLSLPTGVVLDPATTYYIMATTIMSPEYSTTYGGLGNSSEWRFTTGDGDTVPATVEDAAPNGGDGNGDGIKDSLQPHIASFVSPVTGRYVTIAVPSACTLPKTTVITATANSTQDTTYRYPLGMADFAAYCTTPGFAATIKLYFHDAEAGNYTARKFIKGTYATISAANISTTVIGGKPVLTLGYTAIDGNVATDNDGIADGIITDPAGLGVQTSTGSLAGTGEDVTSISLAVLLIAGLGVAVYSIRPRL